MTDLRELLEGGAGSGEPAFTSADVARRLRRGRRRRGSVGLVAVAVIAAITGTLVQLDGDARDVDVATEPDRPAPPPFRLVGEWSLLGASEVTTFGERPVRLIFGPHGTFQLLGTCNDFSGTFTADGPMMLPRVETLLEVEDADFCVPEVEGVLRRVFADEVVISDFDGQPGTLKLSAGGEFVAFTRDDYAIAPIEVVRDLIVVSLADPGRTTTAELADVPARDFPPVRTQHGLVALVGRNVEQHELWIHTAVESRRLASRVAGFAVDAGGDRVAWAEFENDGLSARLVEWDLAVDTEVRSLAVDRFARVRGYAGDVVLAETGDGAEGATGSWVRATNQLVLNHDFGTVFATSPHTQQALLGEGDGTCGRAVDVAPDGSLSITDFETGCDAGGSRPLVLLTGDDRIATVLRYAGEAGEAIDSRDAHVVFSADGGFYVVDDPQDGFIDLLECDAHYEACSLAGPILPSSGGEIVAVRTP